VVGNPGSQHGIAVSIDSRSVLGLETAFWEVKPVSVSKCPTVSAAARADLAMLFARCVRRLREQLGLSVKRAAELSGMETSDWYALEAGWVPSQDSGLVDAIAGTLECGHIQTSFIAEISRYNQEVLFNTLPLRAS
jgi:hypothetical protein